MPHADVVVIGAGLSGLVAAARLAEAGAAVTLVAKGHARTHWGSGGLDIAAPHGATTPADGIAHLAGTEHPYRFLGADVAPAVAWLLDLLAAAGLPYAGSLDAPVRRMPTSIGGTRPAAIVPEAQAAALRPWAADEILVVAGIAGFKDLWPGAVAGSLGREAVWMGDDRPAAVHGIAVELAGLRGRRNLSALHLAGRFDDARTRADDIARLASAVEKAAAGKAGRVALPAVFGLEGHAEAWAELRARLPLEPFEVPLVPPSVPGLRLYRVLRERIRAAGGRVQIGERVARVHLDGDRVIAVEVEAAVRTVTIRTGALVLATGGLVGGGLVATGDGRIVEPVLGLHVTAPGQEAWLAADALDPAGHPVETAGVMSDDALRPLGSDHRVAHANVHVVGGLLAHQHAIRDRCGDGVAIASGWRAAGLLARGGVRDPATRQPDGLEPAGARADR
jgi:glycerol-3-phosphate dehydrogenase subunit B